MQTGFKAYLKAFGLSWGASVSGAASVPIAGIALFVSSTWQRILWFTVAAVCFVYASYELWNDERTQRKELSEKLGKLESEPNPTWQQLADRFNAYPALSLRATFQEIQGNQNWSIYPQGAKGEECKSYCRIAGTMLVKSRGIKDSLSAPVAAEGDPLIRWMKFLYERYRSDDLGRAISESNTGVKTVIYFGSFENVAELSARACVDCAAQKLGDNT
jgi:hypothetical protein